MHVFEEGLVVAERVENKQQPQNSAHKILQLQAKRNYIGIITDITGPLLYKVKVTDGTEVCHHVDSVKEINMQL